MVEPAPLGPGDPERLGGLRLLGRLGAGGQGTVYLGRYLGRAVDEPPVAVKLLHAELLGDAAARARFVREAALLQRVAGFCTAQVLEADLAGDRPYIVSEYVPGPSLRDLVRSAGPRVGGDLDRLAVGTATALAAIHRAGVVHRDLKPRNVLVGPDGPRVIDFGVARALDAGATLSGPIVGTLAYMAPEQLDGGAAGPAADLFAWAATLVYAATGRDAFAAGSLPAVIHRIKHETPDLAALPGPVAEIAAACLAKDPRERPDAQSVLLRLLGDLGTGRAVAVPPVPCSADSGDLVAARSASGGSPPGVFGPVPAAFGSGSGPAPDECAGGDSSDAPVGGRCSGGRPERRRYGAGGSSNSFTGPERRAARLGPRPPLRTRATTPVADAFGGESGTAGTAREPETEMPPAGSAGTPVVDEPVVDEPVRDEPVVDARRADDAVVDGPVSGEAGFERGGFEEFGRAGRRRPVPRVLVRSRAAVVGLGIAAFLAAADLAAVLAADAGGGRAARVAADVAAGPGAVPGVVAVLAVVTLVAAPLAWRGVRAAAWTAVTARLARLALWAAFGAAETTATALHTALTTAAVFLLARALSRRPRRTR
ncbi:serine/threonine-protein kinase [Actinomadura atramentaria]|uniref:serine/threonine-protein kinase n=1 Tax=Actinomadura atramentaria TaxID=1990 RepID=UPI00039DABB6|nr:serine/threonine-protein kinase [Actinomadura atramentaria]